MKILNVSYPKQIIVFGALFGVVMLSNCSFRRGNKRPIVHCAHLTDIDSGLGIEDNGSELIDSEARRTGYLSVYPGPDLGGNGSKSQDLEARKLGYISVGPGPGPGPGIGIGIGIGDNGSELEDAKPIRSRQRKRTSARSRSSLRGRVCKRSARSRQQGLIPVDSSTEYDASELEDVEPRGSRLNPVGPAIGNRTSELEDEVVGSRPRPARVFNLDHYLSSSINQLINSMRDASVVLKLIAMYCSDDDSTASVEAESIEKTLGRVTDQLREPNKGLEKIHHILKEEASAVIKTQLAIVAQLCKEANGMKEKVNTKIHLKRDAGLSNQSIGLTSEDLYLGKHAREITKAYEQLQGCISKQEAIVEEMLGHLEEEFHCQES